MREAQPLLFGWVMQATTRTKSTPPPIPMSARRKPGPMTEIQPRAPRPTVTVWIGNNAYQAILV